MAKSAIKKYQISIREACRIFSLSRTAFYYCPHCTEDGPVKKRLIELAKQHPTYGYWKLYYLLRDEGFLVNHKRVYRLYKIFIGCKHNKISKH